jgi:hypothetical protein
VAQRRQRNALHVVGRDEVAAVDERCGTGAADECERAPRTAADDEPRPLAGGAREAHGVVDDLLVDALLRGGVL